MECCGIRRRIRRQPELRPLYNRLHREIRTRTTEIFTEAYMSATKELDFHDGAKFWVAFRRLTNTEPPEEKPLFHNNEYHAAATD